MENEFEAQKISQEEIEDFLKHRKLSDRLLVKIKKLQDLDNSISKLEALELILDFEENN